MVDVTSESRLFFTDLERQARLITVYSTIIGYPVNTYADHKRPRSKTLVGYALLMAGDYVVAEVPIDFDGKLLYCYENREAQLQANLVCNIVGVLKSIENLGNALGFSSSYIPPRNLKQHRCPVTSIWFKVFDGTILRVGIQAIPLEQCEDAPPIPFVSTPLPSQGQLGDGLGDKTPSVGDGSGLLSGGSVVPPGNLTDPSPENRGGSTNPSGRWYATIGFANFPSSTVALPDTDASTVWAVGGDCNSGGTNNGRSTSAGPYGTWVGKTVFRNGQFYACVEDGQKGDVVSVSINFVEGG